VELPQLSDIEDGGTDDLNYSDVSSEFIGHDSDEISHFTDGSGEDESDDPFPSASSDEDTPSESSSQEEAFQRFFQSFRRWNYDTGDEVDDDDDKGKKDTTKKDGASKRK
jgi:hypothetical protein